MFLLRSCPLYGIIMPNYYVGELIVLKRIVSLCMALLLLVCLIPIGGVSVSAANEDLAVTSFSWNVIRRKISVFKP